LTTVIQPLFFALSSMEVRLSCIRGTRAVPPKHTISELKKLLSRNLKKY